MDAMEDALDGMDAALEALDSGFAGIAADAVPMSDFDLSELALGFSHHPGSVVRALTPRILRKVIVGDLHPLLSMLGEVLERAWRDEWESSEGAALHQFLLFWWQATLTRYPSEPSADDLFELLFPLHDDGGPWLARWEATSTEASDRHLADLVRWQVPDLLNGHRLRIDFRSDRDLREHFVPWLNRYAHARMRLRRDAPGHFGWALLLLEQLAAME